MFAWKKGKESLGFSPIMAGAVFAYSLLFFGLHVHALTIPCLVALFPFLPAAYASGWAMTGLFHNADFGYPLGAWLAVFIQAYILTGLTRKILKSFKEK